MQLRNLSPIDPDGRIAFSLEQGQSDVLLAQWFGPLRP
jgi:hypothetical protein